MNFEKNSAFIFTRSTRYYLTHPWEWFKDLKDGLVNARMRVKYGFCWLDIWNYAEWYLQITPQMLRYLGLNGHSYPVCEPFNSDPGRWSSWLLWAADELDACREENFERKNEYYADYMKELESNTRLDAEPTELDKKYFERYKELALEAEERRKKVMILVAEYLPMIWD